MTKQHGPCAYDGCEVLDDEELVVEPCTACQKPVHYFCSNALLDGDLDVRVCSVICRYGCAKAPAASETSKAQYSRSRSSSTAQKKSKKRAASSPPPQQLQAKEAYAASSSVSLAATTNAAPSGPVILVVGVAHKRRVGSHDAVRLQIILDHQDLDESDETRADREHETRERDGECGSADKPNSSQNKAKNNSKKEKNAKKKPKKCFFTQEADLALFKEMLSLEPYAAEHGFKKQRYHQVADNLSEHLKVKLLDRTVKDRLELLLVEFKLDDQSYRKKSGVSEQYTEHKRLLQDLSDRIRDVEEEKKKKNKKKKDKAAALQTQGEILRDQAVKRRSERDNAATGEAESDEGAEDCSDTGDTSRRAPPPAQGTTKPIANSAGIMGAFMEFQSQNRDDNKQFQRKQLELLESKSSAEASKWEQEFSFKKKQQMIDQTRWKDELQLRREEMQLRRDELQLLRDQFETQQRVRGVAQPEFRLE
ncbi:hypothetical protein PF005_g7669 [Phytophthora fragariae]|uniref:Uncharacterized protein n=1 Tax=Phytophthora fragariae TaxID=53985 RepID=A0A6A3YKG6_9STRA|nr:hypothetical protein PF003_g8124 [Phytophthora fragariae]KAE9123825.1 hypothetical protein PF007_g6919 [Phytophthora fragariae]KAE9148618.1 hypothetical protein PF006_g6808 [Phytophthora fragariae]KAE9219957.1 hypothetical protein PF005_g7669 [Phytophthora fragariae]KAE9240465.1 hypothetical protein PF002_g9742 [Phytophthora fragariae]